VELQLSVIETGVIAMSVKCHLFLSAQSRVFAKWTLLNGDIAISPKIFCWTNRERHSSSSTVETLTVYPNDGVLECNNKGDMKGYGKVWCHPDAIANNIFVYTLGHSVH
jgi:hypothetical protein